jgi:hypothetical protein
MRYRAIRSNDWVQATPDCARVFFVSHGSGALTQGFSCMESPE